MTSVTIERADNGWVVTSLAVVPKVTVYTETEEEALLTEVHRLINPHWNVGDRVVVRKGQQT